MRFQTTLIALLAATALTACSGGETASAPETKTKTDAAAMTVSLDDALFGR